MGGVFRYDDENWQEERRAADAVAGLLALHVTRDHARRYLRVSGSEIGWDFVRAAYASVCRLAVLPLPDLLSLGCEGRFNTPGRAEGNWQWRYSARDLDCLCGTTTRYLRELGELYDRAPGPAATAESKISES